jgi:iron complex outermembrane receptor protein
VQLSIRGFGARSTFGIRGVRLYVDGIPATLPDGQGQITNVELGSTDRIEVLRGPFSALYGNSSGGVIQVFSEEGRGPPTLSAGASLGSFDTRRVAAKASGANGSFGYVVGASIFKTDGYRDHSEAERQLGNAKLTWQPDGASKLTFIANRLDLPKALDPLGLTRAQFEADPRGVDPSAEAFNTRKTVDQTQLGAIYERSFGAANVLRLLVYGGQRDTEQFQSIPVATQGNPLHPGGVISLDRDYAGTDLRWTTKATLGEMPFSLVAGLAYDALGEKRRGYQNFVGTTLGVKGELRPRRAQRRRQLRPVPAGVAADVAALVGQRRRAAQQGQVRVGRPLHRRHQSRRQRQRQLLGDAARRRRDVRGERQRPPLRHRGPRLRDADAQRARLPAERRDRAQPRAAAGAQQEPRDRRQVPLRAGRRGDPRRVRDAHRGRDRDPDQRRRRSTFQNAGATRRRGIEVSASAEIVGDLRLQGAVHLARRALPRRVPDLRRRALHDADADDSRRQPHPRHRRQVVLRRARVDAAARLARRGRGARAEQGLGQRRQHRRRRGYATFATYVGYLARIGAIELSGFGRVDNVFDRRYAGSVIVGEGNGRFFEPAPGRTWAVGGNIAVRF